jgi:hypothetical protein
MAFSALPARYLDQRELAELVENLAARPDLWSDQVDYAGGRRHYASIHRDEYVDIWLICWSPGNDTGWHDHDVSSGAVRVVRGALTESNPRIGGVHAQKTIGEGCSVSTPSMALACCAACRSATPTNSAHSTRRPPSRSGSAPMVGRAAGGLGSGLRGRAGQA